VWAGAALIAASLAIMIGLLTEPDAMRRWMSTQAWYVWASLLAPTGYVMQDVVADAMTVEAVPAHDADGNAIDEEHRAAMHTTMQTLGRMAVVGGGLVVALANVVMLDGVGELSRSARAEVYADVHRLALAVPVVSVLGVVLAGLLKRRARRAMLARGVSADDAAHRTGARRERPRANPWMLGGGAAFAAASVAIGLADARARARGDLRAVGTDDRRADVAAAARARPGRPPGAADHRRRRLGVPRHAHAGARPGLVDDRRARLRRVVPGPAGAGRRPRGAGRAGRVPPFRHAQSDPRDRRRAHAAVDRARAADAGHGLGAARVDGRAHRRLDRRAHHRAGEHPRSSRRSARWRWCRCSPGSPDTRPSGCRRRSSR
jgi:hypothetical protein